MLRLLWWVGLTQTSRVGLTVCRHLMLLLYIIRVRARFSVVTPRVVSLYRRDRCLMHAVRLNLWVRHEKLMLNLFARLATAVLPVARFVDRGRDCNRCWVTLVPHRVANRDEYRLTETRVGQMTLV